MKHYLVLYLGLLGGLLAAQVPGPLGFLPADQQATLEKGGEITVFSDRFENLSLWKGSPFGARAKELFAGRDSTLAAEALFLIPCGLPGDPAALTQKITRAMTSVSTMKDLQVYSISLKRMETFIFDAYRVGSLDKKAKLPDPEPAEGAPTSFPMFQNEEQTGESFAQYTFTPEPGWFLATQTNLTSLNYGIVPLVGPGDLLTAVFVVPFGQKVLVYGVTAAKTFGFFGLERTRTASLYTRMRALVTWFSNNLKENP